MGESWSNCDPKVKEFVNSAITVFKEVIPEKLSAVILHGSLAMGSFYPPKSDIDILILVNGFLDENEQRLIHGRLLSVTDRRPITGFLELSVIKSDVAKDPEHPILYEMHYGENFPALIREGKVDYTLTNKHDPDLAAHFVVARHRGLSLYGPEPKDCLGEISWENYLSSVLDDLNWILDQENILESPFYSVLNACRSLEMLDKGAWTVSTKEEGALWALKNLPPEYADIIKFALECYQSAVPVSPEQRRRAGVEWPDDKLLAFRDYIRTVISERNPS
jgi:predicted nucleotidyltransferase